MAVDLPVPDRDARMAGAARASLGLRPDAPLRLFQIAGPGDAQGSFAHWAAGHPDPRSINATYSHMFYDLVRRLGAEAVVAVRQPVRTEGGHGIAFAELPKGAGLSGLAYHRDLFHHARVARRLIARADPHVVVAHSDFPQMWLPFAAGGRRVILALYNAYWVAGPRDHGLKSRVFYRAMRRGARHVDAAVVVSDLCRRQLRELTGPDVPISVYVPQVVDVPVPHRRAAARRFLFAGRLERGKGVFDLLEAFGQAVRGRDGLELRFAGGGGALAELEATVAASGLPGVRCLGQLDRIELAAAFDWADVHVCPTRREFPEGLAKSPLEAALFGVPSILSDAVPAAEMMGEAALVYPASDVPALARAIGCLVDAPDAVAAMSDATVGVRRAQQDPALAWDTLVYEAILASAPAA